MKFYLGMRPVGNWAQEDNGDITPYPPGMMQYYTLLTRVRL